MNLVNQISISSSKIQYLINATNTYKETGLLFLGENLNKEYVIVDVLNFGFLSFFPTLSNFFNINVVNLVSYFFFVSFFIKSYFNFNFLL